MSRMVGTVSMGIRAPIIRSGDDLVEIVTNGSLSGIGNKLLTDSREDNYRFFKTMTYMAGWRWWAAQRRVCCAFTSPSSPPCGLARSICWMNG